MKEGTRYAASFKRAYLKLKQAVGSPSIPEADDPVRRLAIGILGIDRGDDSAVAALERAFAVLLDWNELRVSSPEEVHRAVGESVSLDRCGRLVRALRAIYLRENKVSLDRLKTLGRREARQYLDSLDGIDDYAAASVVLWSLGGHAIPVSDPVLAALRGADLIHPDADRGEVQAFLERHVSASDAKETCLILQSLGPSGRKTGRVRPAKMAKMSHKRRLAK